MLNAEVCEMTGAKKQGGDALPFANIWFTIKAKKKLIATHPNSKLGLTHSNHSRLAFSNRNTIPLLGSQISRVTPVACSRLSRENLNPGLRFSNRNSGKIEITLTHSKQTIETISNRNYSRGLGMTNHESFLAARESRFTARGLCDTFLRGIKQNWRNSNHA
jgi:hypothetical protein